MGGTVHNLERCQPCANRSGTGVNCPVTGKPFLRHAQAGYCPLPNPAFGDGRVPLDWESQGLGDTIGKITAAVGIKPCPGCKERQRSLNTIAPY